MAAQWTTAESTVFTETGAAVLLPSRKLCWGCKSKPCGWVPALDSVADALGWVVPSASPPGAAGGDGCWPQHIPAFSLLSSVLLVPGLSAGPQVHNEPFKGSFVGTLRPLV